MVARFKQLQSKTLFLPPPLLSVRSLSSSCAAPRIIDYNNIATDSQFRNAKIPRFVSPDAPAKGSRNGGRNKEVPRFRLSNGSKRGPRNLDSPDLELLPMQRGIKRRIREDYLGGVDDDGGVVNLDRGKVLRWYSETFRYCAVNLCLNEGKVFHANLIKIGIDPDSHLFVSLINFYAKCGALSFARRVLDEMPEKDVVSWTALISGFVAEGLGQEGVELFCEMRREGIRPNEFTLATVLRACSMVSGLEFGKQLHAEVVKGEAFTDVYVGSALVDLYAKCGEMEYADKVFFIMPEQNAVSWNVLLNGYAQLGDGHKLLILFCKMTESDMRFSNYTLSTVLKGCASSRSLRAGQVVHSMAIKIGSAFDDFISCGLVDMYSKCELANDALQVFKMIRDPDIVTWSTMISGLDQQGQKLQAVELFRLMMQSGLRPNQFSLSTVVSTATDLGDPHFCKSIHACIWKFHFESDLSVSNALITMYMKLGLVYDGLKVFSAMSQKDVVSWNALLSGYHDGESSDQGPMIFKKMLTEGLMPNQYTFISTLRSCTSQLNASFGKQVHAYLLKSNLCTDGHVGIALIDMYSKCRCLDDVELIFNRLSERDIFTWTVLIAGYAQTDNQGEKALGFFNRMHREGVKANEFTLASCLSACAGIASLINGQQLHSWAIKSGHFCDVYVASALVDMYGKCGCIDDAEMIFKSIETVDTVLWNTMICGHSKHGQNEKALQSFGAMLNKDVQPNGVSFIGVLSACSHMGLVEEGKKHFHLMSELYGIAPSVDHYACMVDILGRAGRFSELESFIQHMKIAPNTLIWETVLGACKIHGNVEMGEKAAQKLFEIDPDEDSSYIWLSNIYAAKGRWNDVSRIRALMSSRGVKKEPGCSWVEVDAKTHVFLSQDASHPRLTDIYQKLEDLHQRLQSIGYTPNTHYVLHNVPDAVKKENLFHHSERLALAFALVSNANGGRIRIFKNLRICGDCHEFMKGVSDITNKEIVIRDSNRFHHFHNGICSCKDYW
ncbi:putative pentatricopeptide repeat-containing protein At3g23330 isoform X1 [Coffea arabica]|uniref:Pentatricopeptide repeat-containing protein At3g23330 isoform X1 n=2 Tax=Coffea arabica TaxID=13443 RepID=A0ABM4UPU5_COFAR